jgi:cysteine dioxygenase
MDLLELLSQRFGSLLNPSRIELMEVLNQMPDLKTQIEAYVTEPKEYPYGRNVIYSSEEVEIIVVNLPAKGQTFIHDHGKSEGCGLVLQGELINAIYEVVDHDQVRKINEHKVQASEVFNTPYGMIHQMLNRQVERVVSLHVYSPPLKGLKVYPQPEMQSTH